MKRALPKAVRERKFIENASHVVDDTIMISHGYHLESRANQTHTHWTIQAKKTKAQRELGFVLVRSLITEAYADGQQWLVTCVRIAPRDLDSDNLPSAFKSIRDGVADALGTDDKWKGNIKWEYNQERNRAYGIRIELTRLKPT